MIQLRGVHKSFGENHVLRGLNLDIQDGETLVIIGGSGCGKSVLLKLIVGLIKPDSGSILVGGEDITRLGPEELRRIQSSFGLLFQGAALFDSLTVGENVAFGLRMRRIFSEEEIDRIIAEKLSMVGLEGIQHLKPAELSGGMKKRVALARALATNPRYMLYDEPSTGLDPIMADAINDLIVRLHKEIHVSSVAVTHDMVSAYKISSRIAMLYEGLIYASGSADEFRKHKDPVVHQFVTGNSAGPIQIKVGR